MEPGTSFATSPTPSTTSNDAPLQSAARGHELRSACDFCHEKRIKCVMAKDQSRCQQCKRRNAEECKFSVKIKTGPKPKRSRSKPDTRCYKRRKTTPGSRLEIIHSSVVVADPSAANENRSTTHPLPTLVASTNQQRGGRGSSGDVGFDGMAAPCGYFRTDLIWNVDDYLRDEDTLEFIPKFEAKLESFDAESASNAGVAKEGVSVRESSNAANEFGQAVGEVGTRLPGKSQDVCLPMVSQCDSLLSDTRACPAPLGASESDAAGGMPKERHLERLKAIGSNPWGLHGDIYRGSGRL